MSLNPGTPAPWFIAPSPVNPQFGFSSLGGRYVVLAFLPEPGPERDAALACIEERRAEFSTPSRVFFGVLPDAASYEGAKNASPFNWFADLDGSLRRLFQAVDEAGRLVPQWVIVDPSLRIMAWAPLAQGRALLAQLIRLGEPEHHAGVPMNAPVLIVPRILEPALCRQLIELYDAQGGEASGVMREQNGRTVGVLDDFKKRKDTFIQDSALKQRLNRCLNERLAPEIEKAFQFKATYVERHIVACYDAADGGYFKPHRDNTTAGTAHRKFAVSINLNAEAFEGGDLRFPEFGPRTYRPPTGGAVVFSCSLLHEATPVTRGRRYAFLPFLYDPAGQAVREANLHRVGQAGEAADGADRPAVRVETMGR
jgi:predicted 2-oxoglutarate/Fe(II)-dependent dioxygenase YbiX/peroxiredoxin